MFPTPAERKVAARSQEINDRGMELQQNYHEFANLSSARTMASIEEFWRRVSLQIEVHFTDDINIIDVDEVAKNIPSYDYLTKHLTPKNNMSAN